MTALWVTDHGLNFKQYQKEKKALNPKWPIREFFKKPTWNQWDFALKSLRLWHKIIEISWTKFIEISFSWTKIMEISTQNHWDFNPKINEILILNHWDFDPKIFRNVQDRNPKFFRFGPEMIVIWMNQKFTPPPKTSNKIYRKF